MSVKKIGIFAIKILITGAILAFLFSIVDVRTVYAHVTAIPLTAFLCAVLAYFVTLLFGTLRWSLLLSAYDIKVPLGRLFAYNFSWLFYTIALPGGKLAAEAVRIYQILADTKDTAVPREKIIIASLMDRVIAVIALAFVALPFFIFMRDTFTAGFSSWVSYGSVLAFLLIIAFAFVPLEILLRPIARFLPPSMNSIVSSLGGVVTAYRRRPDLFLYTLALSFAMNLALAGGLYAVAVPLGISIPYLMLFAVFCIGMLAAMIPITVGGIGLKEGALAYLLAILSGAPLAVALSASLIMLGASLSVACIGGLVELHRHFVRPV